MKSQCSRTFLVALLLSAGAAPVPALAQNPITAALDTGLASDVMLGVRVAGFDFVDNDADNTDRDSDRHGTNQALIFNDVAPASRFMPLRTYTGNGDSGQMLLTRGQAAIDFALDNPDVKVIMLNRLQPIDVGRLQTAVNRDVVVVINAGNQGKPNPEGSATLIPQLAGGGLIVAGHDSSGEIADESNRPGPAFAAHTITALFNSPRTDIDGTSFAMARVSAAAARVKGRDPHLTPFQVVEILKRSAIDAGEPGVDAVYGHGLLDVNAALDAIGDVEVPGGGGGGGSSSSSGAAVAAALVVGGGLYALFQRNKELKKTLVLDEYGRSFWLDMTVVAPRRDDSPLLELAMDSLDREQHVAGLSAAGDRSSFAVISLDRAALDAARDPEGAGDPELLEDLTLNFVSRNRESGSETAFGINEDQRERFGALALAGAEAGVAFYETTAITAPFMGFTSQGLSSAFSLAPVAGMTVKLGLSSNDDHRRWGLDSDSAFVEASYEGERWGLSLQLGELLEDGSLFGGASDGAFSVDSAKTLSLGLSGSYRLGRRTTAIGSYTLGFTDVDHKEPSLLRNFSTLTSDSYGVGLVSRDLVKRGDAAGIGYFQPLRVRGGAVDSMVPYARDVEGNVYSDSDRYSLVPTGREQIFELYYAFDAGRNVRVGSHFLYRDEALHDADADRERLVMLTLENTF